MCFKHQVEPALSPDLQSSSWVCVIGNISDKPAGIFPQNKKSRPCELPDSFVINLSRSIFEHH